jgi:hypothetical protein
VAEPKEQRTRRMKRRQRILQAVGVTRTLKCWYSFEISLSRMPRVLTYTEGNTESTQFGEGVEVRRSPQAVACRERYVAELGKPLRLPSGGTMDTRHRATEAQKGKPGHGATRAPDGSSERPARAGGELPATGTPAACRWGVLSGIVL